MTVKLVAGLLLVKALTASPLPMPSPQLIVKSQSNLFREQPGRQVDLSQVLPTKELFWLNLEEVGVVHRGSFKLRTRKQLERLSMVKISPKICQNLSFLVFGSFAKRSHLWQQLCMSCLQQRDDTVDVAFERLM